MDTGISEKYEIYRGNVAIQPSGDQSEEELERINFCRERYVYMANSRSIVQNKWLLAKELYDIYDYQLQQGETWNAPYRYPFLFGAIQRKASELINNLPEVRVHSTRSSTVDFAIASQAVLDHTEQLTNTLREKVRCIYDTLLYGTGIIYEGYAIQTKFVTPITDETEDEDVLLLDEGKKKLITYYNGVVSERVDPRDFLIDDQALIFYDETGISGARDCFRRRYYPYSTFMEQFKDFKNIDKVVPVAWGTDFFGLSKLPFPRETQEQKMVARWVVVYEYWNQELDMVELIANNQEIFFGSNPFKHKRLPFTVYYNYRRDDSCWGISETEILAPFIYSQEEIINLQLLDEKLKLQPAMAVSGDITFNAEENELQPGAIFRLRGLNGGKVGDAIAPLNFGRTDGDEGMNFLQKLEDIQIQVTGDDTRALYENPDQLATQTMAKQQTSQKRIRSNVMQNTIESERSRVTMRLSNIVQFYAKPYQNIDGNVEYRRIRIEGYSVKQDDDETKPMFEQQYGLVSNFTLNPKAIGDGQGIEIEIVDAIMEDNIKEKEIQDMMTLLGDLTNLLSLPQGQQVAQQINVIGLIKQIAKKMNVDYDEIFPMPVNKDGEDETDLELQLVAMGVVPDPDPNVDPQQSLRRYIKYMQTKAYKKSTEKSQQALLQLIKSTNEYAKTYTQNRLAVMRAFNAQSLGQANMAQAAGSPQNGGGASTPGVGKGAVPTGGATSPDQASTAVSGPTGVPNRLGYGTNQSPSNATQQPS
jgi:hypothetical protein